MAPRFTPDLQRYESEQGLPQNSVTALLEDRAGYLWIGTYGGLVRHDGQDFRVYGSDAQTGPPSDRITALLEDAAGRLWIGTENGGVGRMDADARFRRPASGCGQACRIRQLMQTGAGEIIAVGDDGAYRMGEDLSATSVVPAILPDAYAAAVDPAGGLWLADSSHILPPGATQPYALPDGSEVLGLLFDAEGVWASAEALWRLQRGRAPERIADHQQMPRVHGLALAADGARWIGAEERGVWRVPADGAAPQRIDLPPNWRNPVLLSAGEQAMWIGGDGQGLARWRPAQVGGIGGPGTALAMPTMALLPGSDGALWIGAFCGGLHRVAADGQLTSFELPEVAGTCVWSLAADGRGGLLAGYARGRIVHLDPQGRPLRTWRIAGEPRVRALHLDADGTLWVGASQGLFRGALDGAELLPVSAFGVAEVSTIRPARGGGLWIGSDQGVVHWRDQRVQRRIGPEAGLGSRFVRSVYEDSQGSIWIGTYGGGLHRLQGERMQRFTRREGLAEDFVSCILEDGRGRLWLAGNRGLSSIGRAALEGFDGRLLSTTLYTRSSGMPASETNGGSASSCAVDAQGRLLFALITGVAVVDPARIQQRAAQPGPRVDLVEARVDGRVVDWREGLTVDAASTTLALRYAAPSLVGGERVQFRYRLDGPWIEVGATREILLSALPWGHWPLELAARIDGGPWTAAPTRLLIAHPPPWYRDTRIFVGLGLLALSALLLGVRARTVALRQRAVQLDRLVAERTAALAEANRRLAQLARTDPLTGIGNRRHFAEQLAEAWADAARPRTPLSLIALDVDAFKAYNDGYGHPAGDACLQRIASLLRAALAEHAPNALLARTGGEEFVVLLSGLDTAAAVAVAETLRKAVADSAIRHEYSPAGGCVSVSLGVAGTTPQTATDPQTLVERADAALYRAKLAGRNRVVADPLG
jgi:diguanylate cyclase (GGDEF)-like protein